MEQTGHLTRSVFERYNIVSEDDLRGAAERLGWAHKQMEEKAQEIASGHKKGTIRPVK
jgi:hypothetical protein